MNSKQKTLYLVRHAKSSWSDSSLDDRQRPLNKRGLRSAPEMGRRLLKQGHIPDLIVSSPANRAMSTAGLIARELSCDESEIITDEGLYFSGAGGMIKVLEGTDDQYQKVMVVGHNPAMTELMNILASTSVFNMPTCAIAVIAFDMPSWARLRSTKGRLLGYDYPKGPGSFTA